ncbi:MAG: hypothetical protein K8R36_23540 [Planctomycetales bacterium]|nr:hypothetical protein [Planctomycetales bacterium]
MLRLNPNDNQGVRHILAGWLLEERRLDDVQDLLQRYQEDSAAMQYSRALLSFCEEGDSQQSCRELRKAKESNEFLARYLAGADVILPEQPEFYSPGDEREGMIFARYYLPAWRSTPGAILFGTGFAQDDRWWYRRSFWQGADGW